MKRHEAIAPLSRDHHTSLILVQLLKKNAPFYKGLPDNEKDKALYALQQFNAHIKKHFQQEEDMLEIVIDCHPDIKILAEEIKEEHKELAGLFLELQSAQDLPLIMDTLAVKLGDHIRKEERVLFPMLQDHCSSEVLGKIHTLLH